MSGPKVIDRRVNQPGPGDRSHLSFSVFPADYSSDFKHAQGDLKAAPDSFRERVVHDDSSDGYKLYKNRSNGKAQSRPRVVTPAYHLLI
jgi:hypothetical protein